MCVPDLLAVIVRHANSPLEMVRERAPILIQYTSLGDVFVKGSLQPESSDGNREMAVQPAWETRGKWLTKGIEGGTG